MIKCIGRICGTFTRVVSEGRDVVRVAKRMTDVVMQELSGQQHALHGRTTTVTLLGKPKVSCFHCILVDSCLIKHFDS